MARYRGTLQGKRGPASRLGTPSSGLTTTTNGWHVGVTCSIVPAETDNPKVDRIYIDVTGGSNNRSTLLPLGTVIETPNGPVFTPSTKLLEAILSGKPNLSL